VLISYRFADLFTSQDPKRGQDDGSPGTGGGVVGGGGSGPRLDFRPSCEPELWSALPPMLADTTTEHIRSDQLTQARNQQTIDTTGLQRMTRLEWCPEGRLEDERPVPMTLSSTPISDRRATPFWRYWQNEPRSRLLRQKDQCQSQDMPRSHGCWE
jgi:hypothetical protein